MEAEMMQVEPPELLNREKNTQGKREEEMKDGREVGRKRLLPSYRTAARGGGVPSAKRSRKASLSLCVERKAVL
jgi:hypothetical protein